jgi:hypothetical protein
MSWMVTSHVGALQLANTALQACTEPLFEAFIAGAWILHWTEDTVYWIAKPTVHVEPIAQGRRLHNSSGPALDSDLEPIYFWHGVMVDDFVVERPETITVEQIQKERNAEVRRVLLERYTFPRYIEDSGAKKIHEDEFGELYRAELDGDEPIVMVRVLNSTAEDDGSRKPYFLRVPPIARARDAVAWTFGYENSTAYAKALVQQA